MQATSLTDVVRVAKFEYDFAKHGGAVGAITVKGKPVPAGAIILDGGIHVKTAVTSTGNATVALKAIGADDLSDAVAKANLTANAMLAIKPVGTAATWIRVATGFDSLTFTVGTEALATGKIAVWLKYVVTA
jgi:hypothetical protein